MTLVWYAVGLIVGGLMALSVTCLICVVVLRAGLAPLRDEVARLADVEESRLTDDRVGV